MSVDSRIRTWDSGTISQQANHFCRNGGPPLGSTKALATSVKDESGNARSNVTRKHERCVADVHKASAA